MARLISANKTTNSILIGLAIAGISLAIYSVLDGQFKAAEDRRATDILSNVQAQLYELVTLAQVARVGDRDALAILPDIKNKLVSAKNRFLNEPSANILEPGSRDGFRDQVDLINTNLVSIEEQTESIVFLTQQLEQVEQSIPQVQQTYTSVVDTMLRTNSPPDQVAEAQAQVWRGERLLTSLNRILSGVSNPEEAAEQFRQDVLVFNQVLIGMKEGNLILGISRVTSLEARELLSQAEAQFADLSTSIDALIDAAPALTLIGDSADVIVDASGALLDTTAQLTQEISALPSNPRKRPLSGQTILLSTAGAVLALGFLGLLTFLDTRRSLVSTESTNEKNQEAILRLLDEIADLGEGDLTVHATVTEDFTGAIADSINYAIEQLRALVARVANTAESVAASSNETRATSLRLSEASEHQAVQISQASSSINEISGNLNSVSESAQALAETAQRSVTVAENGSDVVQRTIGGMDNIREQIQDTAKRIKRLGESSQEIGDIVSLINEIADQTNILALNASIQAAMAGEAGRGFAVVADEVQGLAERAASSTRQIESLVKTIQTDTNEAVASMEQTTSEVVRGAQLTNDAGQALAEIRTTSNNVASLILEISEQAKTQSSRAEGIVGSMRVIQDISAQALEGSNESARAVGELSDQAAELRQSIADFRLPSEMEVNLKSVDSTNVSSTPAPTLLEADAEPSASQPKDDDLNIENDSTIALSSFAKDTQSFDTVAEPDTAEEPELDEDDFDMDATEIPGLANGEDPDSTAFDDLIIDDDDLEADSDSDVAIADAEEDEFSFTDDDFLSFDIDQESVGRS